MLSALYGARLMNVFERTDGLVAMSACLRPVNGWPGGIIQRSRHRLLSLNLSRQSTLQRALGDERLSAKVGCPTFDSTREGSRCLISMLSRAALAIANSFHESGEYGSDQDARNDDQYTGCACTPRGEAATKTGRRSSRSKLRDPRSCAPYTQAVCCWVNLRGQSAAALSQRPQTAGDKVNTYTITRILRRASSNI